MKKNIFLTSEDTETTIKRVRDVITDTPHVLRGNLKHVAEKFIKGKTRFLQLAEKYPTPFYVLDAQELKSSIREFDKAFRSYLPNIKVYYAVKTNYHAYILKTIVDHGWGLDVSSVREFNLARESGCTDIIYTGPGKSIEDLRYVLGQDKNITVQIDSFGELERLGIVTEELGVKVKAGIRIYTSAYQSWSKFGIPLQDLKRFWDLAKKYSRIELQGIQFHLSWNENANPYKKAIKELAEYLQEYFSKDELHKIRFIDFGGGFRPYNSEGTYPWLLPQGNIIKTANDYLGEETDFSDRYFITPSVPIEEYAKGIGESIQRYLSPILTCEYYTEPGRIISNNSMHILIKAIDKKAENKVIMNGGINSVGWERFQFDYCPVINLSHPSLDEQTCTLYGSLCMPQDLWGYYYYGSTIEEGDICIVPYQGTLTYTLAQNFILPIPPVYILE